MQIPLQIPLQTPLQTHVRPAKVAIHGDTRVSPQVGPRIRHLADVLHCKLHHYLQLEAGERISRRRSALTAARRCGKEREKWNMTQTIAHCCALGRPSTLAYAGAGRRTSGRAVFHGGPAAAARSSGPAFPRRNGLCHVTHCAGLVKNL